MSERNIEKILQRVKRCYSLRRKGLHRRMLRNMKNTRRYEINDSMIAYKLRITAIGNKLKMPVGWWVDLARYKKHK